MENRTRALCALIAASVVAAFAIFAAAWLLRGRWATDQVSALKERLTLAGEQLAAVQGQLADVTRRIETQDAQIAGIRSGFTPAARLEHLAQSNTEIRSALTSLASSTSHLGHTLTLAGAPYRLMVKPIAQASERSS
jgi:phage shock protein A